MDIDCSRTDYTAEEIKLLARQILDEIIMRISVCGLSPEIESPDKIPAEQGQSLAR